VTPRVGWTYSALVTTATVSAGSLHRPARQPTAAPFAGFDDPQLLNANRHVCDSPLSKADQNGRCDLHLFPHTSYYDIRAADSVVGGDAVAAVAVGFLDVLLKPEFGFFLRSDPKTAGDSV